MADSLKSIPTPKLLESYTKFMQRCIGERMEHFDPLGNKLDFGAAYKDCKSSWMKSNEVPKNPASPSSTEDTEFLLTTEQDAFLLTEESEYMRQ